MSPIGRARSFGAIAVLLLTVGAAAASRSRSALPIPEHIPQKVRTELKMRMSHHAAAMMDFVQAVALLDRPAIQSLAEPIMDGEVIAQGAAPISEDDRRRLPQEFFLEQIALSTIARQLAVAATHGDEIGISDRFGSLARTCVACHSGYLHGRPGS